MINNTWRKVIDRRKKKKANQVLSHQHLHDFGKKFIVFEAFPRKKYGNNETVVAIKHLLKANHHYFH